VPRRYRSSHRETQARLTRQRVLAAATAVFLDRGYVGATMRTIATEAGVSVPTVESLFGTKARVLKAAIDVAIAGDDEPIPVLDRSWTDAASRAETVDELLSIVAGVIGPAQARSSGLVLAVFEGSSTDSELAALSAQMVAQRGKTAEWLVGALSRKAALRDGCGRREAIDTVWMLMDPAVFDRLTRQRHWTQEHYRRWFAGSVRHLLIADIPTPMPTTTRMRSTP
jgi:TetR/AcrR family transcriptional regulator, regulator of autoinduction and epiphytic fitness